MMSRNDEPRIVERHLAESLEPAAKLAASGITDWVDFGSGAGFPAIPLAIAGVGERWTLVESRRPKTLFMRKTLGEIGLVAVVSVSHGRLEALVGQLGPFGGFTARATERLGKTLDVAASFIADGGRAYLWKGSSWRAEMDRDRSWELRWRLVEEIPLSAPNVVVVVFERHTTT